MSKTTCDGCKYLHVPAFHFGPPSCNRYGRPLSLVPDGPRQPLQECIDAGLAAWDAVRTHRFQVFPNTGDSWSIYGHVPGGMLAMEDDPVDAVLAAVKEQERRGESQ